jgi:hypothetical protein
VRQVTRDGRGAVGLLLSDAETRQHLSETIQFLHNRMGALDRGEGTLGLLLTDDGAYKELMRMLESFRESGEIARENAPLSSLVSFTSLFFDVLN